MAKTQLDTVTYSPAYYLEETSNEKIYGNILETSGTILQGNVAMKITAKEGSISVPAATYSSSNTSLSGNIITVQASVSPTISEGWINGVNSGVVSIKGTIPTQVKTVTPTTETQTVTCDSGYLLEKVNVNPIPSNYTFVTGTYTGVNGSGTFNVSSYYYAKITTATYTSASSGSGTGTIITPTSSTIYYRLYRGWTSQRYIKVNALAYGNITLATPTIDEKGVMTSSVASFTGGQIDSQPSNVSGTFPLLETGSGASSYSSLGHTVEMKYFEQIMWYRSGTYSITVSYDGPICFGILFGDVKLAIKRPNGSDTTYLTNNDWYPSSGNIKRYKVVSDAPYYVNIYDWNGNKTQGSVYQYEYGVVIQITNYGSYPGLIAIWHENG